MFPPTLIPYRFRVLSREAALVAWAAIGGALFALLEIPAAWLSGSMLLVSVIGVARPLPDLRKPWFDSTMVMSGALIGSAATPEALAATARYPGSLFILVVGLVAIMLTTGAYLRFVARWSWIDSLLAAAPGALSTVIAVAESKGANLGRIAAIQLFRILVLIAVLPSIMKLTGAGDAGAGGAPPVAQIIGLGDMVLLLGCALATGIVFERLRVTAPYILGATLASTVLYGSGTVHGTFPPEIAMAVMVMLGAAMGGRVSKLQRNEIAALFPLAIGGFLVSMLVAFAFAWPAAWLAGVPYASAMAAFAPGGLEAMAMLAFAMGLDPLYVGAHHLVRFMLVGLSMPFVIGWLKPEKPPPES
ncbi:MAG: AbrB family transcriptional regulator [Bosea sp.]|uniref:AbrB family transcriptional regulator n=1 Tax=Bosea sp. (in: a-proteobacteria) TaxID=1871050 RepID=UPI001AD0C80E|nr:AbrB family transcriptional regulator [Bosea sp. (in: a-proteobacteria)]MBN9467756.1 AbrB family transcriptional regulator [Bosea sp. (in: a-proteobacteria)]